MPQIRRPYRPLGAVDGVGGNEVLAVTYLQNDVGLRTLYVLERFLIGGLLAIEDKVVGMRYLLDQLLRLGGMVYVHHIYADVLHLLVHHPRHDTHDHDGEYEDNLRHERVAAYLQELFDD